LAVLRKQVLPGDSSSQEIFGEHDLQQGWFGFYTSTLQSWLLSFYLLGTFQEATERLGERLGGCVSALTFTIIFSKRLPFDKGSLDRTPWDHSAVDCPSCFLHPVLNFRINSSNASGYK